MSSATHIRSHTAYPGHKLLGRLAAGTGLGSRFSVGLGVGIVYYLAGWLGVFSSPADSTVSPVWPAAGVAIAACLIWGNYIAAFTAIAGGIFTYSATGNALASLGAALTNGGEPLLSALLTRHFVKLGSPTDRPRDVFFFIFFGAFIPTVLGSVLGNTFFCYSGQESWENFSHLVVTWWLGDFMGAVIVAPFLLTWFYHWPSSLQKSRLWEMGLMAFTLLAANLVIFFMGHVSLYSNPTLTADLPLIFLTLPLFVWSAVRFEHRGVTTALLVTVVIAILAMQEPAPKIQAIYPLSRIFVFQYFMGVTSMTVLALAAAIAEQRASQRRLVAKAEELSRSNADLEQFAYVASHDLQEPLRMVASYCQLIERRFRSELGTEGAQMITHAVQGAARMRELIHDLLTYSRVGRSSEPNTLLDLNEEVSAVLRDLESLLERSKAEVVVGPLPKLHGTRSQLRVVFQNLIVNAIKYCDAGAPHIDISSEFTGSEWVIHVRDNGIGIDAEHHQRIFLIFQRLHGKEKYSGTGIGLAICKKIVEQAGGRIWVDSRPGHGSTFHFSRPV